MLKECTPKVHHSAEHLSRGCSMPFVRGLQVSRYT